MNFAARKIPWEDWNTVASARYVIVFTEVAGVDADCIGKVFGRSSRAEAQFLKRIRCGMRQKNLKKLQKTGARLKTEFAIPQNNAKLVFF